MGNLSAWSSQPERKRRRSDDNLNKTENKRPYDLLGEKSHLQLDTESKYLEWKAIK